MWFPERSCQTTREHERKCEKAGRELRVIVKPEEIDDLEAHKVAREVKEQIEANMKYPGTIKITVVRETRAQEEAK